MTKRSPRRAPPRSTPPDPLAELGLSGDVSEAEIAAARRRLAKSAHPDTGGSLADMQRVNAAADAALRQLGQQPIQPQYPTQPAQRCHGEPTSSTDRRRPAGGHVRDHPSFTIEALPAEAFEALLVVACQLGEIVDDDPPYAVEVMLADPLRGWCRLELVPDAGASTVAVDVAAEPGAALPDPDAVRDAWIEGLNALDWTGIE